MVPTRLDTKVDTQSNFWRIRSLNVPSAIHFLSLLIIKCDCVTQARFPRTYCFFFFTVYLNSYIIVAIWENSDGQTDAPLSLELKFYRASILIVIIHISYLILRLLFSRTRVLVLTLWAYILLFILIYWTRASNKSRIYFYTFKFRFFFFAFSYSRSIKCRLILCGSIAEARHDLFVDYI